MASDSFVRRRRPSSASSSRAPSKNIAKGDIGLSPWQPQIEGGNHSSYSEIGGAQLQPLIGESGKTRLVPPAPANPSHFSHQVSTSSVCDPPFTEKDATAPSRRRLTFCPHMRSRGICGLPSCPYVHEAFRSRKEHTPFYGVNAPKTCQKVPCRFLKVLGCCPYAEACAYSHDLPLKRLEEATREPDLNEDSGACTLADQGSDVAALLDFLADSSGPAASTKKCEGKLRGQSTRKAPQGIASRRRRTLSSNVSGRSSMRSQQSSVSS